MSLLARSWVRRVRLLVIVAVLASLLPPSAGQGAPPVVRMAPLAELAPPPRDHVPATLRPTMAPAAPLPLLAPQAGPLAFAAQGDILRRDADGGPPQNLTQHPATDTAPAWSPDGTRLAFLSDRDRDPQSFDLYVMRADGSQVTRVTTMGVDPLWGGFDWAPHGQQLVVATTDAQGVAQIAVVTADGSTVTPLGPGAWPRWSPTGTAIAMVVWPTPDADGEVRRVAPNGSAATPMGPVAGWVNGLVWHPAGDQVAVTTDTGCAADAEPPDGVPPAVVSTFHRTGTTATVWASQPCGGFFAPAWSPDGTRLSVVIGGADAGELVALDAPGATPTGLGAGWGHTWDATSTHLLVMTVDGLEQWTPATGTVTPLWSGVLTGWDRAFPPAGNPLGPVLPADQEGVPEALCLVDTHVGGPIHTRTGALWTEATDLVVASPGPALVWQRTYHSPATALPPLGLGPGWQHPYATRLILPTQPEGEAGTVIVVSPKGNWLRYSDLGNGELAPWPGVFATLVADTDGYTRTLCDQTQHVFDATTGQLTQVIDPQGRALLLAHDDAGRLTALTDARDPTRQLTLTYDGPTSQIASVSDGTRTVTYTYDGQGDLTAVQDVMGRPTTYQYQQHLLTRIANALGQPLEITAYETPYLPSSKAISQTLQDGRQLQLDYRADRTVITTTAGDGQQEVEEVFYTPRNTLAGRQVQGQAVLGTTHDAGFRPTQVADGNGTTTRTTFTATGRPEQLTNALGETTQVVYNDRNQPTVITDPLQRRTELTYDSVGNLIRQTTGITTAFPLGFTTVYTYTSDHWLAAQQGPDGVVTGFDRDALGQLTHQTVGAGTPEAQVTRFDYDNLGRVVTTTVGVGTPLERVDVTVYHLDDTVASTIQNYQDGVFDPAVPDADVITTYGYDALGRRVWVQDVLGRSDVTHYDAAGRVDGTVRNLVPFAVDPHGAPVFQPFDPASPDQNVATRYGYDGLGRTTLITQTGILTGTFDPLMRTFDQATERVTHTAYDDLSRPITVTLNYRPGVPAGPDVNVQTLTRYDAAGNVIGQRDALGRWTMTTYDALNRPVQVITNYENGDPLTVDAANQSWATVTDTDSIQVTIYRPDGQVAAVIANYVDGVFDPADPAHDRSTVYEYDALGRVTQTIHTWDDGDPTTGGTDTDRVTVTAYDAAGRVQATQDALGRWVSQQYDARSRVTGHIQHCTDASGVPQPTDCASDHGPAADRNHATTQTYDALGRVHQTRTALGQVTQLTFDGLGRTVTTIQHYQDGMYDPTVPDTDVTTTTAYDALGRVIATTDAEGATTTTAYDALGRAVATTDAAGRTHATGSDGTGTARWSATPDGRLTVQQVDGLGRVVTTITNYQDGAGAADAPVDQDRTTRTVYDAAGRRIATVDPGGRETRFAYDLRDTLIVVTENATDGDCPTEPCNVVTQYQYDRAGNRVAVIDARGITTRQTTYDAADRLVTMTDGLGQTTGYQYDRGGRRIGTSDPRGPANDVTITYDDQDRQTGQTATNLDAPIHMAYDVLGRRTTVSDGTGTTSVTHDALGRITRVTAPETGTVAYGYNARGQRTQLTSPDGTTISYQYDPDGALHQVRQDGTPLATYAYDAAGRLASVSRANGAVTTDAYDGADRLRDRHTTVDGTTVSRYQYTVDRLGLRTAVTETLTTQTRTIAYTYDGLNRLTGATETPGTTYAYAYDLAGNRTATWENGAQTQDLAYNAANQMIGGTYDAAGNRLSDGTTTATYDALNRLTQQDGTSYIYNADGVLVSDGTTTYTQDLAAPLSQILADGSATYVYGAGSERLRAVDGPWYLGDALGSVRTTLDDAGAVVATASYDPWGTPQGDLLEPFGFTGELHHGEQVYLRARWYHPGWGTFPTRDPFAGWAETPYSLHAYQYAYSAPTVWTDPSGEVIGDVCTPPYAWHAEEKVCVLSSDVPPWLRFLPEKRDPTFAIPAPMLVGSAPGAIGQLGGRPLGHLGREGLEACTNLIGGTLVWMLTQTQVETQTRRDDKTQLWRAVKEKELADIVATGTFQVPLYRDIPMLESKYFSLTLDSPISYAKLAVNSFDTGRTYTIVQTSIRTHLLHPDMFVEVDKGIPSVVIPVELFPQLASPVILPITVP